jgi:Ca2+-binding EF-hand superfamily protein
VRRSGFLGQALAALSLLLMGAAPTVAQNLEQLQHRAEEEEWGTRQPTFTELDLNRDGYLSRKEAARWGTLKERFEAVDKNNDNQIDRTEFGDFETQLIQETLMEFKGSSD